MSELTRLKPALVMPIRSATGFFSVGHRDRKSSRRVLDHNGITVRHHQQLAFSLAFNRLIVVRWAAHLCFRNARDILYSPDHLNVGLAGIENLVGQDREPVATTAPDQRADSSLRNRRPDSRPLALLGLLRGDCLPITGARHRTSLR